MQCLRTMLRFAAAPTFILLAAINYEASSTMSAHIGMSTGLPPSETLPFKLAPELSETLGSGLIVHSQKMTAAAMQIADMKVWAHRS